MATWRALLPSWRAPDSWVVISAASACAAATVAYSLYLWRTSSKPVPPLSDKIATNASLEQLPLTIGGTDCGMTVVFIHGMGCSTLEWAPVVARLQGLRWAAQDRIIDVSESTRPRTAPVIVAELRSGLAAAGIAPPYVLVGHSYGGLIARSWALR